MKKILIIALIVTVFLTSFSLSAVAESVVNNETSVTLQEQIPAQENDFSMSIQALEIMGIGMLGIFAVTGIIVCVMLILCKLKDKDTVK